MNILIIGATSAIAQAVAKKYCTVSNAINFILVGRGQQRLEAIASDLKVRSAEAVTIVEYDFTDLAGIDALIEQCWSSCQGIDIALIAHGNLPEQEAIQNSWSDIQQAYAVNSLSYLAVMTALAERMEQRNKGSIAVIASVAGDRGRQSNYIYGSAKGSVSLFAQGLRNRLESTGVHVITIKPGFVDTPMTADIEKGGPLWATPEKVAENIVAGIEKRRNVVYTPWFWWVIMTIIKLIPEPIFKKLSL